jgi:hypothetical protein
VVCVHIAWATIAGAISVATARWLVAVSLPRLGFDQVNLARSCLAGLCATMCAALGNEWS